MKSLPQAASHQASTVNEIAKANQRFDFVLQHWVADFYRQTEVWKEMKRLAAAKEETMEQVLAATAMYGAAQYAHHKAPDSEE